MKRIVLIFAGLFLCTPLAFAQYTSDLDDATGWTVVADEDTEYEFGFDYAKFGIPAAPNGTGTTGLRMAANIANGAAAAISASPDVTMSGQYQIAVDFWLNFNTSGGTTEFIGAFTGFDGSAPLSGAGFLGDSDGDSGSDYRLYKNGEMLAIDSGQYAIPSLNNVDPVLQAQFPGQPVPAAQGDANVFDPTNVIVTAQDGSLGFAWHRLMVDVDSDAKTASFFINDFKIGTVDGNVDPTLETGGAFALTFADLFSSVSTKPEFSFGVFDNLSVTQVPEPNGLVLGCFAVLGLLGLRRRR